MLFVVLYIKVCYKVLVINIVEKGQKLTNRLLEQNEVSTNRLIQLCGIKIKPLAFHVDEDRWLDYVIIDVSTIGQLFILKYFY